MTFSPYAINKQIFIQIDIEIRDRRSPGAPSAQLVVGEPVYKVQHDTPHPTGPVLLVTQVYPRRQVVFDDVYQVATVTGLGAPDLCEAVSEGW